MIMTLILLYILAGLCILCGAKVIYSTNKPVVAVFYLVCCYVCVSLLLFYLNHEFFALIYIMVYVGAIAVLFLFVIMMLSVKQTAGQENNSKFGVGWGFGLVKLICILFLLDDINTLLSCGRGWFDHQDLFCIKTFSEKFVMRDMFSIGVWLFNSFPDILLVIGGMLLISMVGSIMLVSEDKQIKDEKKENESFKVRKRISKIVELHDFLKKKK